MRASSVLRDGFDRVHGVVGQVLDGVDGDVLLYRPDPDANTVAWLAWHLARVEDDHLAGAFGTEQVWTAEGWSDRFGLDLAVGDIGYGHDADEVAKVRASAELLGGYAAAVHARTVEALDAVGDDDELDRVVDDRYDPPVTLGARLVSVIADTLQHAGQAAYLRGLAERTLRR